MSNLAVAVVNPELKTLAAAKRLSKIEPERNQLARLDSVLAENELVAANDEFTLYIDQKGKASTSPKGVMLQIHKRIKLHFGFSVNDNLSDIQSSAIATLRKFLSRAMLSGMESQLTRREIKKRLYSLIEKQSEVFNLVGGL